MNDLTTLQHQLPDELKAAMAAEVSKDLERLGNVGGGDTIRVTQDKKFVMPDGTEGAGPLRLVVLDFVYANEYYAGVFNRKEIVPPTCFAINADANDMVPSTNSPVKQNNECKGCQWNEYGSSPTGDGKACKNGIKLAVKRPGDDEDVFVIKISPTGAKFFNKHVAAVGKASVPLYGALTEISFAPDATYPSLRFGIAGFNERFKADGALRDVARHRLLQEPDVSSAKK
jgi:hypothetical protein